MTDVTITNLSKNTQKLTYLPGAPVIPTAGSITVTSKAYFDHLGNPRGRKVMEDLINQGKISINIGNAPSYISGNTPVVSTSMPKRPSYYDYGITMDARGFPNAMQFKSNHPLENIDMALILCHYGQDEERLRAAKEALTWTLQSNPKPFIIIVEATEAKQPKHFNKTSADLYITRIVENKSKGIWLKEALWTIGAKEAVAKGFTKLTFLDIDSAFIKQDWAKEVSKSLDINDIVSPHSHRYFSGQIEGIRTGLEPTKGYLYTKGIKAGHPGIAISMTSNAFSTVFDNRLPFAPNSAGDVIMWFNLTGWQDEYNKRYLTFEYTRNDVRGIRPTPRISYVDNIVAHYPHGPINERNYTPRSMVSRICFPVKNSGIGFDDKDMPYFTDIKAGNIFLKTIPHTFCKREVTCREIRDVYDKHALEEYGPIDDDNPLTITCLYRAGGIYTPRHVQWLKEQFDRHCKAPFRFVCQTNEDIPGVETVPLITTFDQAPFQWGQIEHYRNIWGENTSVITCDLDTVVYRDFTPHQCPKGEVFMTRESGNWIQPSRVTWNCGFAFFRGNFQPIVDMYLRDYEIGGHRRPDYAYIGSQENICGCLREMGVYPKSVEAHFCVRFYPLDPRAILSETTILSFPGNPKPWDIKPRPNWIPEL